MLFNIGTGSGSARELFDVGLNEVGQIYVCGGSNDVQFTNPNLIDNQWHTIAVIYSGASLISLYIDGDFIQSPTLWGAGSQIINTKSGVNNWLGTSDGSSWPFIGSLQIIQLCYNRCGSNSYSSSTNSSISISYENHSND